MHKVKWSSLPRNKKCGGLQIKSSILKIRLGKWLWIYTHGHDSLWGLSHQVLKEAFGVVCRKIFFIIIIIFYQKQGYIHHG